MILFLVLSKLKDFGFNIDIKSFVFLVYFIIMFFLVFIGFLEDRFGFFSVELDENSKRNPQINKIINKLDKIEKILKGGKNSINT